MRHLVHHQSYSSISRAIDWKPLRTFFWNDTSLSFFHIYNIKYLPIIRPRIYTKICGFFLWNYPYISIIFFFIYYIFYIHKYNITSRIYAITYIIYVSLLSPFRFDIRIRLASEPWLHYSFNFTTAWSEYIKIKESFNACTCKLKGYKFYIFIYI